MLTEKDYCDYETCVALKELYFNSLVDWYFNEDKRIVSSLARYRNTYIPRISLYEAQKWLREEKGIVVDVSFSPMEYFATIYINVRQTHSDKMYEFDRRVYAEGGDSYEEALLEGIKEAVKLLKEERK